MTALPISDHPTCWRVPVSPSCLVGAGGRESSLVVVPGGAVAAGTRADAVVLFDDAEVSRRSVVGAGPVRSLHLLDVLLGLPLEIPIRVADLTDRESRILGETPDGYLRLGADAVTRTVRVPATVAAALVRGTMWRAAMRRTAAFSPLTQRIVVLPREPKATEVLEAQLVGVGIWEEGPDGSLREHLAPEVFVPRYVKAAGWLFAEDAYGAAVAAGTLTCAAASAGS